MKNYTLAHQKSLQDLAEAGAKVATVVYDPTKVTGSPEAVAAGDGWAQFYREATASLVEVIYTK